MFVVLIANIYVDKLHVYKYVRPNTRTEMYAGRVACFSIVSHVE